MKIDSSLSDEQLKILLASLCPKSSGAALDWYRKICARQTENFKLPVEKRRPPRAPRVSDETLAIGWLLWHAQTAIAEFKVHTISIQKKRPIETAGPGYHFVVDDKDSTSDADARRQLDAALRAVKRLKDRLDEKQMSRRAVTYYHQAMCRRSCRSVPDPDKDPDVGKVLDDLEFCLGEAVKRLTNLELAKVRDKMLYERRVKLVYKLATAWELYKKTPAGCSDDGPFARYCKAAARVAGFALPHPKPLIREARKLGTMTP